MKQKPGAPRRPQAVAPPPPSPRALGALALLAGANALWSAFLWRELVRSRSGLAPFCALGAPADCAAAWNGPFAQAVGRLTHLPVAGWGLVWSLAALALPLLALRRGGPALVTAVRLTAGAGVMAVFALVAVSAAEKAFCSSCAITYLLVAGYAAIALFGWSAAGLPRAGDGLLWSAGAVGAAFLVVLVLGPVHREPLEVLPAAPPPAVAAAQPERALSDFVGSLSPPNRQVLADALHLYRQGPSAPLPPPPNLLGSASAPVRVTEWTDILCSHCADLHATWQSMLPRLPPGSVSVESRHYPLDGLCNPQIKGQRGNAVRCLAARAQICMEKSDGAFPYQGALFASQRNLTPEMVFSLALKHGARSRAELEACVRSEATTARLQEDVNLAGQYQPEGTPLVVVNGRKAVSAPGFLYAIILAKGDGLHPAFGALPAPNPQAHLH